MMRTVEISLTAVTQADLEFVWHVYRTTMRDYIDQTWGWDGAMQRQHFAEGFDPPSLQIIHADGVPAGYLSTRRDPASLHLAAIALLPKFQNIGIGAMVLKKLIADAAAEGLPVDLQVLKVNPARALYERLGFHVNAETETHYSMTT